MPKEFIVPEGSSKTGRAFSPAIKFDIGDAEMIFVSGLLPKDAQGNIVGEGDIEAQTRFVFEKMITILREAGAELGDLVKVDIYLVDMKRDFEKVSAVRNGYLMESKPAATTVGITRTMTDGCDIEIDAIAMKRK
jgi:enamine deaminase RidA (YjgF/YER057c/UK114 family)